MKCLATVLAILGLMAITSPSYAYWTSEIGTGKARGTHSQYRHEHVGHYAKAHPRRSTGRYGGDVTTHDANYWLAVRQGGPCGLTAERESFGRSDHVLNGWNPWLAADWKGFPVTSPAIGMVAVWRNNSHVEVIHNLNGNGTFNRGWSLGLVVVVNPHGEHRNLSYAYRHARSRHRRYAAI